MSGRDLDSMVKNDLEKFQDLDGDMSMDPPAILELVFISLTAVTVLAWFASMFLLVPDTIPSKVWMGGGLFGLVVFGVPAALVFFLRRGGVEVVRAVVRGFVG